MEQNYESDYLKTREDELTELHEGFFNRITKIERELKSNDDEECEELNCEDLMQENYEKEMEKFNILTSKNAELLMELENLKAGNCDDVDIEFAILPCEEQKSILMNRLTELLQSKHLAGKIVSNLLKELEMHQQREHDLVVPLLLNENRINSHQTQFNQIENDVNNEVQRIEKVFLQKYKEKLKAKLEFDKLNEKLTSEVIPHLAQLERDFLHKSVELKKVDEQIMQKTLQLEKFREIEKVHQEKLKKFEKHHEKILSENEKLEKYLMKLEKGINHHEHKIAQFKKKFDENLMNIKENAGISQRIKELEIDDLQKQLNATKLSTICQLKSQDSTIKSLCQDISKITKEISKSKATIETFQKNLKILRSDT